jgi:hypothetical protein
VLLCLPAAVSQSTDRGDLAFVYISCTVKLKIVRTCGRGRLGTCGIVGMTTGRLAPLTLLCRVKRKKRKLGIVWFGLGLVPPHAKLILL